MTGGSAGNQWPSALEPGTPSNNTPGGTKMSFSYFLAAAATAFLFTAPAFAAAAG